MSLRILVALGLVSVAASWACGGGAPGVKGWDASGRDAVVGDAPEGDGVTPDDVADATDADRKSGV